MIEIDMPVHPAAAVFPMLSDDELRDLAEDIKANGLLHPIVRDTKGRIVDGRNRYVACRMAGVAPTFATLADDVDVVAFILSQNVHRRHMSKGQLAMAVAMVCSETEQTVRQAATNGHVTTTRLANALVVLQEAPDVAALVLSGDRHLDEAYAIARQRKEAKKSDAEQRRVVEAKRAKLRAEAPDLADLYDERRLSLDGALDELERREQEERDARQRETRSFAQATAMAWSILSMQDGPARITERWLPDGNPSAGIAGCEGLWTRDGLRRLAALLIQTADLWKEGRNGTAKA